MLPVRVVGARGSCVRVNAVPQVGVQWGMRHTVLMLVKRGRSRWFVRCSASMVQLGRLFAPHVLRVRVQASGRCTWFFAVVSLLPAVARVLMDGAVARRSWLKSVTLLYLHILSLAVVYVLLLD